MEEGAGVQKPLGSSRPRFLEHLGLRFCFSFEIPLHHLSHKGLGDAGRVEPSKCGGKGRESHDQDDEGREGFVGEDGHVADVD